VLVAVLVFEIEKRVKSIEDENEQEDEDEPNVEGRNVEPLLACVASFAKYARSIIFFIK
jgi:hypothetical protein